MDPSSLASSSSVLNSITNDNKSNINQEYSITSLSEIHDRPLGHPPKTSIDLIPFEFIGDVHAGTIGSKIGHATSPISNTEGGIITSNEDKALEHIMDPTIINSSTIIEQSSTIIPNNTIISSIINDERYLQHVVEFLDYETTPNDIEYAKQQGVSNTTLSLLTEHLGKSTTSGGGTSSSSSTSTSSSMTPPTTLSSNIEKQMDKE